MRYATLFLSILLAFSACKKSDNTMYEPFSKKLTGSWQLAAVYNKANGVSTTYPNTARATTLTLNDSARVTFVLPCNAGLAQYLTDENGGFQLSNASKTALFCSVNENNFEEDIMDALETAYWVEVSSTELKMITPTGYYNLVFSRL